MPLDAETYFLQKKPIDTVIHFLTVTLKNLGWSEGKEEVVMDVGCGPGNVTRKWILPLFPNIKEMIAVDFLSSMIQWAEEKNSHPKINYYVVDFEDRYLKSSTKRWRGKISKLISIHCFNWLKDQKKAFETAYEMLIPGGEAALYFELQSSFYNATVDITNDPKWSKHFEAVNKCIPESHLKKYNYSNYKKMIEDIGFTTIYCQDEVKVNSLPSDEEAKDLYYAICGLSSYVPDNLKEEFKNDYFQYVLQHGGRSDNGAPLHKALTLELVLRKKTIEC